MGLLLQIRFGAAAFLRRCADALAPDAALPELTAGPDPLAALRLRYPGAPEVWLRALAAATPAQRPVYNDANGIPASAIEMNVADTTPAPTPAPTLSDGTPDRASPSLKRPPLAPPQTPMPPRPEASDAPHGQNPKKRRTRPDFSGLSDAGERPASPPAIAGMPVRRTRAPVDFAPDARARDAAEAAPPVGMIQVPPPHTARVLPEPLLGPSVPSSGQPREESTQGSTSGPFRQSAAFAAPPSAGPTPAPVDFPDRPRAAPFRALDAPPQARLADAGWPDAPSGMAIAVAPPAPPLPQGGRAPTRPSAPHRAPHASPAPRQAAPEAEPQQVTETLWPTLPSDPASPRPENAQPHPPVRWAAPRPEQEARTWIG